MTLEVRFVSGNSHKLMEATEILGRYGISVVASPQKIDELQTAETNKLVRDKLLKAFSKIGRPLLVEHTGLYLDHINGLPGGLTQVFWDTLQADKFAEVFGKSASVNTATARTIIAYCDARTIQTFDGEIGGQIVSEPRGPRDFQWDCVFMPNGHDQTFAEMGSKKNSISMRYVALKKLAEHLSGRAA